MNPESNPTTGSAGFVYDPIRDSTYPESEQGTGIRPRGRFLKGPIPVVWLEAAGRHGLSATRVGLALWYHRGLLGRDRFQVEPARCKELGVGTQCRFRGLKALQKAGLVRVFPRPGGCPEVEIMGAGSGGGR